MNSLVCEGRLVAAAVVARLRFSVESVPVTGALESSQGREFHDDSLVEDTAETRSRQTLASGTLRKSKISQSSKKKNEKENILEEVCEVRALEF